MAYLSARQYTPSGRWLLIRETKLLAIEKSALIESEYLASEANRRGHTDLPRAGVRHTGRGSTVSRIEPVERYWYLDGAKLWHRKRKKPTSKKLLANLEFLYIRKKIFRRYIQNKISQKVSITRNP